jgi:hypothetical protein
MPDGFVKSLSYFRHSGPDFHRDKLQPESSVFGSFRFLTPVFTEDDFYDLIAWKALLTVDKKESFPGGRGGFGLARA